MKKAIPILVVFVVIIATQIYSVSKRNKYIKEVEALRTEQNLEFKDPQYSPLLPEDILNFEGLSYYDVNTHYLRKAKLELTPDSEPFEMETTTERRPVYKKYGIATFKINGVEYQLSIYQNLDLIKEPGYEDFLFLPFKDLTNGQETYGGGRFIDLNIPEGDEIVIDFNKAYNPYCAYNHNYSCPIPPYENHLKVKIEAGVKAYH